MNQKRYRTEVAEGAEQYKITFEDREERSISFLKIQITSLTKEKKKPLKIRISVPASKILERWNPKIHLIKALNLDWFNNLYKTNAFTGAPIEALIASDDSNCVCIGLSETLETVGFTALPIEETAEYGFEIVLFQEQTEERDFYCLTLRMDFRPIPYYEVLYDMANWWEKIGLTPASVPSAAKELVYSTWYSYHQMIEQEALISECRLAKEYGCKTLIVDDGWQTEDNNRGYAYCGDWEAALSKLPNIKEFVQKIHGLDMKVMFWYSVPFIGENSKHFEEYKDMLIDPMSSRKWHVLDPRYPKVRNFIIDTYERALTEWKLDGFKLDFVDEFLVTPFSGKEDDERRDFHSIAEAADVLLKDCMFRLKSIQPDILLEFRQTYNGPRMRTYGNIFRAVDCPMGAIENRVRVTDVRLLAKESAVHSDMIMWNQEDTAENAAMQIIHILFSVPQISVKLETLDEEHLKMLKFYCSLWQTYKEVLIHGTFRPLHPQANYSVIIGEKDNKMVCTYHISEIIQVKDYQEMVFVNASSKEVLIINKEGEEEIYQEKIYNPLGVLISNTTAKIKHGIYLVSLPKAGTVIFSKEEVRK